MHDFRSYIFAARIACDSGPTCLTSSTYISVLLLLLLLFCQPNFTHRTELNECDTEVNFRHRPKCHKISRVASYGALGHVPPPRLPTISFLVHVGVNLTGKYCVVCEISWWRCQQLIALSIITYISHKTISHQAAAAPGQATTVSAPLHNLQLCPSSQQILATSLYKIHSEP